MENLQTLRDYFLKNTKNNIDSRISYVSVDGEIKHESYHTLYIKAGIIGAQINNVCEEKKYVIICCPDAKNIVSIYWASVLYGFVPCITPRKYVDLEANMADVITLYSSIELDSSVFVTNVGDGHDLAIGKIEGGVYKQIKVIDVDTNVDSIDSIIAPEVGSESDALILLTSGSTGKSQLVPLTHKNILVRSFSAIKACEWLRDDIVMNWMPLDHSGSMCDWHIRPLLNAMDQVVVDSEYIISEPSRFMELLYHHRISRTWAPNFGVELVSSILDSDQVIGKRPLKLKEFLVAGEKNNGTSLKRLERLLSDYGSVNNVVRPAYGLAETGSGITYCRLRSDLPAYKEYRTSSITVGEPVIIDDAADNIYIDVGSPIECCLIRVVDHDGHVVPDQVAGVVEVKGDAVFNGYLDAINPRDNQNAGWFNTGDVGFFHNKRLVICGRVKEVLIVNGRKVGLNEIEDWINAQCLLSLAIACPFTIFDENNNEKLGVAFEMESKVEASLIDRITEEIASRYGIVGITYLYIPKGVIPRTTIGKLKRNVLSQWFMDNKLDSYIANQTDNNTNKYISLSHCEGEVYRKISETISQVLGGARVTPETSLLMLGGDSISAIRISHILKSNGIDLSVSDLISGTSIGDLSKYCEMSNTNVEAAQKRMLTEQALFASHLQTGMILESMRGDKHNVNIEHVVLHIKVDLNVAVLKDAWKTVLKSHDVFNTTFEQAGNRFLLREKITELDNCWEYVNLSRFENSIIERAVENNIEKFNNNDPLSSLPVKLLVIKVQGDAYRIVLIYHHALLDGWSVGIVMDDLSTTYKSMIEWQVTPKLVRPSYLEFAKNVDRTRGTDVWVKILNTWELNTGLNDLMTLGSHKRGKVKYHNVQINKSTWNNFRNCVLAEHTTLSVMLQSAWSILVANYANTEKVIFGTVVSGRASGGWGADKVVGMLINTFPLKTIIRKETTIGGLFKQLSAQYALIFENDQLDISNVIRRSNKNALEDVFDHLFVIENIDVVEKLFKRHYLNGEVIDAYSKSVPGFPLSVQVFPGEECTIKIIYHDDKFDDCLIANLASSYVEIIEALLASSVTDKVCDVNIRTRSLLSLSDMPLISKPLSVLTRFAETVKKLPDKAAIIHRDDSISYKELDYLSSALAVSLKHYCRPDGVVMVNLTRSINYVISVIASLKAGLPYLPIEPNIGTQRLQQINNDINIGVIVADHCDPEYGEAGIQAPVVDVDNYIAELVKSKKVVAYESSDSNDAYVIYTSGTTGKPKGVLCTRQGLDQLVEWHINAFQLTDEDVATFTSNPGFDAAVWEIWPPLSVGSQLVILDRGQILNVNKLPEVLTENSVTISFLSTPIVNYICNLDWPKPCSLRVLLTGGDRLTWNGAKELPFRLVNNYGPTENAVVTTSGDLKPGKSSNLPTIGKAIPGNVVALINYLGNIVPKYGMGQLVIGGENLMRGYLVDKKIEYPFVPLSIVGIDAKSFYLTGDNALMDKDELLYFKGRKGDLVKVRGYRVNLSEIEKYICEIAGVGTAAVELIEGPASQSIGAVITPENDRFISGNTVVSELKRRIPHYMIPTKIVVMPELPTNDRGKIDKSMIRELLVKHVAETTNGTIGDLDQGIVEILRKYTGEEVDAIKHITQFSLNSIDIAMIAADISKLHKISVEVNDLMLAENLSEFCKLYIA